MTSRRCLSEVPVVILDGAMGTQLRARGINVRDYKSSLWSALTCVEAPEEVTRLHDEYIEAGADVITVNNYAITPPLLARENREQDFSALTLAAARCATAARDRATRGICVAGSLPPLRTSYDAGAVGPFEDNLAEYTRIVELLKPHVDMFICETMSTAEEARAAASAASLSGQPYFVSWTVNRDGSRLRGGETMLDAVKALAGLDPAGLLVNCSSCDAVSNALVSLRSATSARIGAYANPVATEPFGGEPEAIPSAMMSESSYVRAAAEWKSQGASIFGACCDSSPNFIKCLQSVRD